MTRQTFTIAAAIVAAIAGGVHAAPAYKGMSYTSFGPNVLSTSASDQSLLNMSMVGTDTVALNFWWFQTSTSANTMAEDDSRYSSTVSSVAHAIDTIHSLGMKVLLKPMLDVSDANGTWRAYIDPSNKDQWFSNYTNYIGQFADMAQSKGVELLSLGCEMNTLEQSANNARWTNLISNIRGRYNGKLTYSANWSSIDANVGGYQNVPWWNQLDYIGIDAYFPIASSNNTTLAGLTTAWQNRANALETWRAAAGLTNKQVLFTEVGYQSSDGSAQTPWGVGNNPTIDLQEQADAYHALMNVMPTKSWWDGAFWWSWETNPNSGGTNDTGFTPQNKPAQTILQQYYGGPGPSPPPHASPTQRLYSFENDLETWHKPNFTGTPVSLAQSSAGATAGTHSLAVTQTGAGFNWDTVVTLTGDPLTALSLALADNKANYQLVYDVTYNTASIPQSGLTFVNQSIAIQNAAGTWSQVDGVGNANGHTNQTIHVVIPLANFTTLTAGSNSYNLYFALNGNWGTGAATIFFDNIKLINVLAPLTGDFDHNGVVDAADYILWRQTLGTADSRADANFNGVVDAADYQLWRANFGATSTSGGASLDLAQVPEPATAVLLIFACTVLPALLPVSPRLRRGFLRPTSHSAMLSA